MLPDIIIRRFLGRNSCLIKALFLKTANLPKKTNQSSDDTGLRRFVLIELRSDWKINFYFKRQG